MEHDREWPARIAQAVGKGVAYYRAQVTDERGRKLTAQGLADRCKDLGLPLGRPTIAKLEKGLRDTITVGELQVLARALGVAPAALLFPVGQQESVEILPGRYASPWDALLWFSGLESNPASILILRETTTVQLYQAHASWVDRYPTLGDEARGLLLDSLRLFRATMRERGLIPPPLTGDLAVVIGEDADAMPGDGANGSH